jgi:signal transduction histidine kinase
MSFRSTSDLDILVASQQQVSGFSLGKMWHLAEQIGAQLEIQSELGGGTKVMIVISVRIIPI